MDEIRQVEIELKRLREEADHQKAAAGQARKENALLKSRNEYLVNKLKEASYVYGEAGKRLLYFINNQVNPMVERLNRLEKGARKLDTEDKALGQSVDSFRKSVGESVTKLEARIEALTGELGAKEEKLGKAVRGSVRKSESGDAAMGERLEALSVDFDKRLASMKASLVKSTSATMASLEKELDRKMAMLRERNLLFGKDMEAVKKFGKDILGLDGKLQETVSNLSQTRLDMEKLQQHVKAEVSSTKAGLSRDMKALSDDVEKRFLEATGELRQADEKNLGEIRMQLEQNRQALDSQLEAARREMAAFRRKADQQLRKAEAGIKSDLTAEMEKFDARVSMMEKDIDENSRNLKGLEDAALEKISSIESRTAALTGEVANLKKLGSDLSKASSAMEQRVDRAEAGINGSVRSMRESFEKEKIVMRNGLDKIDKKIDDGMKAVASELDKGQSAAMGRMKEELDARLNSLAGRTDLHAKEIEKLGPMAADIKGLASAVTKREQAEASLRARLGSVSQEIRDKSEREDMKLKKQLDLMSAQIESGMEAAESRISRESVKAFTAARQGLRKDFHSIREDNAALKAEMKAVQAMARTVDTLQDRFAALGGKVDNFGRVLEKVSEGTSARVENEALRVSKEMAGMVASVKADIKDMIAREKERFARQGTALEAKNAALGRSLDRAGKRMAEIEAALKRGSDFSQSNRKLLDQLDASVKKATSEIVSWKKEYKVELDRMLKEIEG